MNRQFIPFEQMNSLNPIVSSYLQNKSELFPPYPTLDLLKQKAKIKSANFLDTHRTNLVSCLKKQYRGISLSKKQTQNLTLLTQQNTLTITTGHQLCLASGPAYFIYKILSVIRLVDELNRTDTSHQFVPIYWAASEDHDFEEVNHFYFKGKKLEWNINSHQQAVGRLELNGINQVWEELETVIHHFSIKETEWVANLKQIYQAEDTLAQATRKLIQHLFSEYGVLMLDPDNKTLKSNFCDYIAADLWEQRTYKTLLSVEKQWHQQGFKLPIHPRETNFFFFDSEGKRQRINSNSSGQLILSDHLDKPMSSELKNYLKNEPERFSPNVWMRPLYQEHILPNIGYIGGAAEVAYWLPLEKVFEKYGLPFPAIIHRHSILSLYPNSSKISEQIPFANYLNYDKPTIAKKWVSENSEVKQVLEKIEALKTNLNAPENHLLSALTNINPALKKSWEGHSKKIERQLNIMSNKTLKQASIKDSRLTKQLDLIFDEIYPQGVFQERRINFFELTITHQLELSKILSSLSPLAKGIEILKSENPL